MTERRIDAIRFQRGFTLAEILVTTAIFAIIMIAALAVYDKSNQVFKQSTEAADLQQSTRIGFDKLIADLRMAGFDYSRGGTSPNGEGQFPQPDEQIEFAGPTAIAFRANFDYNTDAEHANGLEPDYTPKNEKGKAIFPYVTTGNDEIVIYALKSTDATKNDKKISFFVDSDKPRHAYPGSPTNGAEKSVTISGIDTTNANPPYTLYRFTLDNTQGTPVAENIRSLQFFYYTDTKGATLLALPPPNPDDKPLPIVSGRMGDGSSTPFDAAYKDLSDQLVYSGAIGGDGQYIAGKDPDTIPNFNDRTLRSQIASVRVAVIGMNPQEDGGFVNPGEPIKKFEHYRHYKLQSLVVPRNLGLTGFPEPNYLAPGPPTITGSCIGHCASPVICWDAPTSGGPVLEYRVEWDSISNGTFPNAVVITDPAIRSATLPDLGGDPSLTWYYRVVAVNENGEGISENHQAKPKNTTQPEAPSGLQASFANDTQANNAKFTDYAVKLSWTSPTKNNGAKSNLTCTGSACVGDGSTIPSTEQILYRVYRGLKPDFDPNSSEAVKILDLTTNPASLLANPGSLVTWADAPGSSAFAPGTCVPYYYRIMAADRCAQNKDWNASGSVADSMSTVVPDKSAPAGAQVMGQAYDAGPGVQAKAPQNLSVNSALSSCPLGTNLKCSITLMWDQVASDNAGHAIGVDRYRLTRYKKRVDEASFTLDTGFGTNGSLDLAGYSQVNSGSVSYTDTSAPSQAVSGQPMYYMYVVAANDCRLGLQSNEAYFPSICSTNPAIVQSGASNPTASGDTPQQAWIMNAGDSIKVTAPTGVVYTKGLFEVLAYPSGTIVDTAGPIAGGGPYTYTWSDRSDLQIYMIRITVTTVDGCQEVHIKYVQDQFTAGCAFTSQTPPAPTETTAGSNATATNILTLTNSGTDPMQMAGRSFSITWKFPDALHNDMVLSSYTLTSGSFSQTFNITSPQGPGTVTGTFPATFPNVAVNGTLQITIRWRYAKKDAPIAATPLTKVCLDYQIASEPGVTKHCNLVGQAGNTQNPNSCD